ncbi:MAG: hypothetical protein LH624_02145 [Cryobacterium sp.]|nr:hypothetical protein [Cryobacterium sp.]
MFAVTKQVRDEERRKLRAAMQEAGRQAYTWMEREIELRARLDALGQEEETLDA